MKGMKIIMYYKRLLTTKLPIRKNIDNGISMCNEPVNTMDEKIEDFIMRDIIQYPDMKSAYDNFSDTFNISKKNFILTNGCEEALRLSSQLILRRSIDICPIDVVMYENPTWELAPIILNNSIKLIYAYTMEDIPNIYSLDFKYNENTRLFYYNDNLENIKDDLFINSEILFYITDKQNNLFGHNDFDILKYSFIQNSKYIIDETYTRNKLFNLNDREFDKNKIYIGSFSKNIGCGIRLGYVLFNDYWYDAFNQYRSNYISALASKYASSTKLKNIIKPYSNYSINNIIFGCDNFETMKLKDVSEKDKYRINKIFKIDGIEFARLGKISNNNNFSKFINSKGDLKL